jgi:hypothetical protein
MNSNLIDIVGLIPEDKLDWAPAPSEWSIRVIVVHIILARYHHITSEGVPDNLSRVLDRAKTRTGLQEELATSWDILDAFLSSEDTLGSVYNPPNDQLPYLDPSLYDGHYVAYHRFAHDLHHRSTLLGHLRQIGVKISDHLIRPLD